ncbi:uncharacterized protein LOC116035939 isoform X1 [Sander lucioperca]|uniref:uncharacterized protein LOC116035939 isoform X1 n=1 Tax=Sander lucioperca TaxID=283035 RepID=UPI00165357D9|nr:uncharacterized protein LOC116035939 isoform X1 [Sander lucioperca]
MAHGVCLGFLLICLVQAEHVQCLWATQDHRLSSNVGLSQKDSGVGGSYPQNHLRQASLFPRSAHSTEQKSPVAVIKSSSLFGTDVQTPHRSPIRTKTSASAHGKRVSPRHGSKTSKRFSSSPNKITGLNSENEASIPNQGNRFSVSNMVSSNDLSKRGAQAAFLPRSIKTTESQHYAPTITYNIPYQYGGFAIRRLKEPDLTPQSYVAAPQVQRYVAAALGYVAPQRPAAPQVQSYVAAPQSYVAPQRPAAPQVQSYVAPQRPAAPQHTADPQSYLDPQQQSASYKPWVPSGHVTRWIRVNPHLGLPHVL